MLRQLLIKNVICFDINVYLNTNLAIHFLRNRAKSYN